MDTPACRTSGNTSFTSTRSLGKLDAAARQQNIRSKPAATVGELLDKLGRTQGRLGSMRLALARKTAATTILDQDPGYSSAEEPGAPRGILKKGGGSSGRDSPPSTLLESGDTGAARSSAGDRSSQQREQDGWAKSGELMSRSQRP